MHNRQGAGVVLVWRAWKGEGRQEQIVAFDGSRFMICTVLENSLSSACLLRPNDPQWPRG